MSEQQTENNVQHWYDPNRHEQAQHALIVADRKLSRVQRKRHGRSRDRRAWTRAEIAAQRKIAEAERTVLVHHAYRMGR